MNYANNGQRSNFDIAVAAKANLLTPKPTNIQRSTIKESLRKGAARMGGRCGHKSRIQAFSLTPESTINVFP